MRSPQVQVVIDLDHIRAAAESIRAMTGVRLIAVIKADAYGCGAKRVADALASVADEFAYFWLSEAREMGRPGLVLGPADGSPSDYRDLGVRPAVGTVAEAERFTGLRVALRVDTGMQRFGCLPEELDDLVGHCDVEDFYSHVDTVAAAQRLQAACAGRGRPFHAAATSLLDHPETWFDAVRPGLALYRGAVRVTTRLHAVRQTSGPIGYTGFEHPHVGVILAGYSNFLQLGPVVINGHQQRTLEIGMNTTFVSVDPHDKPGDEVTLLGDGLDEAELAQHFDIRQHEVLCRYTAMGPRHYTTGGRPPTPS